MCEGQSEATHVEDGVSEIKSIEVAIDVLQGSKRILVEYLVTKTEEEDWHGVCDAANDIRVIEAKLEVFKKILEKL